VRALPKPPAEVPVCRDVTRLAPRFRLALARALAELHRVGFDPVVCETLRTPERQRFLYGFGRDYDDGRGIVTQAATADQSWHGYGLAADVISRAHGWDAPPAFWRALQAAVEQEGLVSGAAWPMADKPHVQWGAPMRRSPSPRAAVLRDTQGLDALWVEVGAAP
jgi:hypothetical protein